MLAFTSLHSRADDLVGLIPSFLSENDPRPAAEQFNERYAHGGGWAPLRGWRLRADNSIQYPDDPSLSPVAMMWLHDETIFIYPHAWVCIVQADGTYEVARMD